MSKVKPYKEQEAAEQSVNEPIMAYGQEVVSKLKGSASETFEEEWSRGLTVEGFRLVCKKNLRDMYAAGCDV